MMDQPLRYLLDPYGDWAKAEGIPIIEVVAVLACG